ncbi:hypothetical protein [Lentibacillus jeotgali]|uniref:hypothetical protein n=1 Tax=Lentibacillus jeotgali TaxID=558169 RepID=UPI0002628449|nr:hypothetical protein [Lentibacillus jeotgali]
MSHERLQKFLPAIRTLDTDKPLTKHDLSADSFLIKKDGGLGMYYAPHNEHINIGAKVVIAGITPGWHQMKTAYEQFIKSLAADKPLEACLKETKQAAGFAGSMRKNLINMLDKCGIPEVLDIPGSADLFGINRILLHTTSIIKYPVFIKGKNYTGHQPSIDRSPILQHYAYTEFPKELAEITPPALVIPLGKTADRVMSRLAKEHKLPDHSYLTGFPHPSGANGHRVNQFRQQKVQLQAKVKTWGDGIPSSGISP